MRWLIRIVLGLLLLAALAAGSLFALYESNKVAIPDLAKSSTIDTRQIDGAQSGAIARAAERLEQLRREMGYPAVSVAVAVDGIIVWQEARGWASLESKAPTKVDTPFAIGSVSKTLTAAVAMKLTERGVLDLDADIRKYLPSFPQKEHVMTVRQLLLAPSGHTSLQFRPLAADILGVRRNGAIRPRGLQLGRLRERSAALQAGHGLCLQLLRLQSTQRSDGSRGRQTVPRVDAGRAVYAAAAHRHRPRRQAASRARTRV